MNEITDKIYRYIEQNNMLTDCERVVTGLSGGADSVCLLLVLKGYIERKHLKTELCAVHVNHGIRQEAGEDEEFARALCERLGVKFAAYHIDAVKIAGQLGMSVEEAGRKERYRIFNEECRGHNARIAVAHHMNDQAETVLMNLARGTSLKGIGGIRAVRDNIIRPLLSVTRAEVEELLKAYGQAYVTDATNLCNDYTRNSIRNVVIPYMTEKVNAHTVENIASAAEELRKDNEFIEAEAGKAYDKYVAYKGMSNKGVYNESMCDKGACDRGAYDKDSCDESAYDSGVYDKDTCDESAYDSGVYDKDTCDESVCDRDVCAKKLCSMYVYTNPRNEYSKEDAAVVLRLCGTEFAGLHEVIRKRVIYRAVHELTQTAKDIYKVHVNAVDELVAKQVGSSADICYGLRAIRGYDDITISRKNAMPEAAADVASCGIRALTVEELERLALGENVTIKEENIYYNEEGVPELRNVQVVLSLHPDYEKNRNYANSCYAKSFDYDKIQGKLCIRSRVDGDVIVVNRAGTCRRLKKEFIDRKVPADMRDNVLLVCDDSGVLWAAGVRRSERALIDDDTQNVLEITIQLGE